MTPRLLTCRAADSGEISIQGRKSRIRTQRTAFSNFTTRCKKSRPREVFAKMRCATFSGMSRALFAFTGQGHGRSGRARLSEFPAA